MNRVQYRGVTWSPVEVHDDEVGHLAGAAGEQTRVFGAGHSGAQNGSLAAVHSLINAHGVTVVMRSRRCGVGAVLHTLAQDR